MFRGKYTGIACVLNRHGPTTSDIIIQTTLGIGWQPTQPDRTQCVNTLRPRQNGRHSADDTFKCIFLNENVKISIKNSLKFVPKGPFNNNSALVQIMAWRRPGDKPLSEPMMVRSTTHICVTRPQWVKVSTWSIFPSKYATLTLRSVLGMGVLNWV